MNSPVPWINEAILTWKREGVALQSGALESYIAEVEQWLGFSFPNDFYEFYKAVNGFENSDMNKDMFYLWPLEVIWAEYQGNDDDEFIAFCDFMINSHQIGFIKGQPGIYKSYDRTEKVADNFKEFIEILNSNADPLY
ncbi:SMI1/KNR4 family protein [Niastella sp. OAS944]|uniref:SMI1/KNR4 family protein n=1 Tax=Niastella sp. OAS944 TaxID=2664089 RepID=UPI00346B6484|nr:hypothetical protein [Chitinophagaceae bacterium OAS944]